MSNFNGPRFNNFPERSGSPQFNRPGSPICRPRSPPSPRDIVEQQDRRAARSINGLINAFDTALRNIECEVKNIEDKLNDYLIILERREFAMNAALERLRQ